MMAIKAMAILMLMEGINWLEDMVAFCIKN